MVTGGSPWKAENLNPAQVLTPHDCLFPPFTLSLGDYASRREERASTSPRYDLAAVCSTHQAMLGR